MYTDLCLRCEYPPAFWETLLIGIQVSAIELKRRAPGAHTFMEVSKLRYGTAGHWIQIIYSTMYQIINCVNILVGGSEVFAALTGMNVIAGCFLLPVGVVIYTLSGGIKATILTDYTHTIIIYALILTGLFVVYSSSSLIGSADAMFELLKEAAVRAPVANNAGGEYLTMNSQSGILLGVIFWCAVFGTTVDVQLYQKAIAANPAATLPGYLIGALAWFWCASSYMCRRPSLADFQCSIPFCLATTFGLACRALENTPGFPTYPRPMSATEISSGLSLPYAAIALMGKGGGAFVLLLTFMACTSGFSADLVAVSSVFVYDVYGTYINPKATGGRLVKLSHVTVIVWSLCMSIIATGITQTTIGVNYLVTCMGVFTCSCVFPMYSTVLWRAQNKWAIVLAPPLGSITAIASWLGSAYALEGAVTINSTSQTYPLVIGNAVSLIAGVVYSVILTYLLGPQNFDWEILKNGVKVIDDSDVAGLTEEQLQQQLAGEHLTPHEERTLYRGKIIGTAMAVVSLPTHLLLPLSHMQNRVSACYSSSSSHYLCTSRTTFSRSTSSADGSLSLSSSPGSPLWSSSSCLSTRDDTRSKRFTTSSAARVATILHRRTEQSPGPRRWISKGTKRGLRRAEGPWM